MAITICFVALAYRTEAYYSASTLASSALKDKVVQEAAKTANVVAAARVNPLPAQIKTLQTNQAVVVKEVKTAQFDKAKILAEHADLKRRFSHVQAELDMCRESNAEKQKQIDTIRKRQYERFMELRAEHFINKARLDKIEKAIGLQ